MGIQDRDYMKRPSNGDRRASSSDSKAVEFLVRFLQRRPRFFVYVGIGMAVLVVVTIVIALLTRGQ